MQDIQAYPHQQVYPLPQPKTLKVLGRFFSYLFHPLFISVYVAAYLIYFYPYALPGTIINKSC